MPASKAARPAVAETAHGPHVDRHRQQIDASSKANSDQVQVVSWLDVLPIHPAANKIPEATDDEKRVLLGDLKRHGLKVKVILVSVAGDRPQLLDGRHRLDLLEV